MKKLLAIFVLLGMVAFSCTENDFDDDLPENIFFALDKESVTISPDGGIVDIMVYSNYQWEISGESDWCTPSITQGSSNENGQKVTFSADITYDDREATFWFRCADEKVKLIVSQKLKESIIPDANNTFNIPAEGGIAVISYQTSVDCEVIIPEDAQDWITISRATRGLVSENINLDIAENPTYDSRSAVIKIVAKDNADLAVEYTINQEQKDAILTDENNTFTVPSEGGNVVIDYQANVDCEIIIPTNAQSWITIVPETRGLAEQSATLHIAENTTYSARTAVVKVVAKGNNEVFAEYTINQEQNDAILADDNNTFTVPSKGGNLVLDYQTNVDCEVIIPEEAKDWITIAPATRGLVAQSATLHITENTTYDPRSAVIKVVAKGNNEVFAEYTINQKQNDAILAGEKNTFTVTREGGNVVFDYQTNVDCEVIIPVEARGWITVAPATKGLTTHSTTLNIAENKTDKQRQAIVKVVSMNNRELFAEYNIIQNPKFYIEYTSTNGQIVKPYNTSAFEESILSNTYENGVGIIEFSSAVTMIGNNAFKDCSYLKSVTIPNSVTTIGNYAFKNCSSVTSVTIPDSVTEIGNNAFYGCKGDLFINSKIIEKNYTSSKHPSNNGWLSGAKFTGIIIGESVTTIGEYAFSQCSSLTNVTIPDSVTSIGERAFYECGSLFAVWIGDNVTSIGNTAFYKCSKLRLFYAKFASEDGRCLIINGRLKSFAPAELTEYTIPNSVTEIGGAVFAGCGKLTSVTIPDGVTSIGSSAFSGCSSITNITIPDGVMEIEYSTFKNCSSLTSVTIPDNVTEIGDYAFSGCGKLTSITITDRVTSIGQEAFSGCKGDLFINSKIIEKNYTYSNTPSWLDGAKFTKLTIGNNVNTIGDYVFYGKSSLTSVSIPDDVTSIGSNAFYGCSSLKSVTIGKGITSIGSEAFYGCTGDLFINCNIPSSRESSDGAFYGSDFSSVTIGDDVTSIGNYAFYECSNLTKVYISDIAAWCNMSFGKYDSNPSYSLYLNNELVTDLTIPNSVTKIGSYAFANCKSITSVTIPDSVTKIASMAFSNCSLTSVTIPNSVTKIESSTFSDCSSLTSVTIPNSVTSIENSAFYQCSSLRTITIPDNVTKIGRFAFFNSWLRSVYCKATTPPQLESYVFFHHDAPGAYNKIGCDIYVPAMSVDAYKNASGWSEYAIDFVGYNF